MLDALDLPRPGNGHSKAWFRALGCSLSEQFAGQSLRAVQHGGPLAAFPMLFVLSWPKACWLVPPDCKEDTGLMYKHGS